ncbi:hypothetical protein chiPu_0029888, partial [Chiloscyllium punctatum]|nr:hypothetical protein [Chiloscyllium punctatum]
MLGWIPKTLLGEQRWNGRQVGEESGNGFTGRIEKNRVGMVLEVIAMETEL